MIIREEIDLNKPVTLTAEQLAKLASAARERNHLNKINKERG